MFLSSTSNCIAGKNSFASNDTVLGSVFTGLATELIAVYAIALGSLLSLLIILNDVTFNCVLLEIFDKISSSVRLLKSLSHVIKETTFTEISLKQSLLFNGLTRSDEFNVAETDDVMSLNVVTPDIHSNKLKKTSSFTL